MNSKMNRAERNGVTPSARTETVSVFSRLLRRLSASVLRPGMGTWQPRR